MSSENVDFFFSNARISQNFRASKAFLDRKRPRDSENFIDQFHSADGVRCKTPAQVTASKGTTLMDISINTPSPCSGTRNRSVQCENRCSSAVSSSVDKTESNRQNAYERTVFVSTGNKHVQDAFITPIKKPESVSLSDSFSTPSLLDDDFDETMLEEIDAICERESVTKAERQDLNVSSDVGTPRDGSISGDFIASSNMPSLTDNRRVGSGLENGDVLDPKEFGVSISSSIKSGSMPDEYSKYLQSLNDKQGEAACSDISIPLMIAAGPGSGKTSTMVGRVLMLLNEGISPSNILAMTFTTAAASEMRERIGKVAGKKIAKELTISTFHSFSLQLCRAHAEKLERTVDFLIFGHSQQRRAIIEAARLSENEKNCAAQDADGNFTSGRKPEDFRDKSKKWLKFVAQAKASGKTPAECREMGDAIGAAILGNYNDILRSCNALDYHDLISCSLKLLTDFPEVFKECQDSWKAIIVDEFQDTSAMQYGLLRILASHNHITIVGDDDQSIFSFNGADVSGFDSFRKDFPNYKEIRLERNYRSTRYIVEAASCLIQNNINRFQSKNFHSENANGSKIVVKECYNEDAQCAYVVDKILESITDATSASSSYGNVAILYRRQISGKLLQSTFRQRNIPFNTHGVAFYRKKVVKAITAMLRTALPASDDDSYRKVFKAFLPCEKEEKKRVLDYVDKIAILRKCSFISAASDIFNAKISGTFKRSQLTKGRKVLLTLDMISKLVQREKSISAVITSVANMVPQKYLLEKRAVIDVDGGKYLNEDSDLRSVLQFLLDDVSDFLKQFTDKEVRKDVEEEKGCVNLLKCFVDYIAEREKENFRSRRHDNENSVTLTTIHQSKGLEWDIVFIVKANETEIPLLHEFNGASVEKTSIEEERRLLYVAMTRAREKLFILYVTMDSNWQLLQPSRFLREIPSHLLEIQAELSMKDTKNTNQDIHKEIAQHPVDLPREKQPSVAHTEQNDLPEDQIIAAPKDSTEPMEAVNGNGFLRRFDMEDRSMVSHLFHQWAKKPAFHQPRRLLDKVRFVIDERLRNKNYKHKDVLRSLKSCLGCEEALQYAEYIVRWEQIPADQRAHLMREKQEHFQKLRMETAMGTSEPTPKQIAYLKTLGCVESPTSRLHASRLIEQYKSL